MINPFATPKSRVEDPPGVTRGKSPPNMYAFAFLFAAVHLLLAIGVPLAVGEPGSHTPPGLSAIWLAVAGCVVGLFFALISNRQFTSLEFRKLFFTCAAYFVIIDNIHSWIGSHREGHSQSMGLPVKVLAIGVDLVLISAIFFLLVRGIVRLCVSR